MKLYRVFLNGDRCITHDDLAGNPFLFSLSAYNNSECPLIGITNKKYIIERFKSERNCDLYIFDTMDIDDQLYNAHDDGSELILELTKFDCDGREITIISNEYEDNAINDYRESSMDDMISTCMIRVPYDVIADKYMHALEMLGYTFIWTQYSPEYCNDDLIELGNCNQSYNVGPNGVRMLLDPTFDRFKLFIEIFAPFMKGYNND